MSVALHHPRLSTARRILAKIEALTGHRLPGPSAAWSFEGLRQSPLEGFGFRWQIERTDRITGRVVSMDTVNAVLHAHRLKLIHEPDGTIEVCVDF